MAPGRLTLGGIASAAALLVAVVAGCGGGGSSTAPGATSPASSTPTASAPSPSEHGDSHKKKEAAGSDGAGDQGKDVKKHPPLELPTGKPETGFTKAQRNGASTADIEIALPHGLTLANTCKGRDRSPAVTWHNLPPGVSELAIFAMGVKPVDGKLYFAWAMAGIDPKLAGLKPGEVPKGAVVGRNSDGQNRYSVCPQGPETYIFALYAIQGALNPKRGFDPLTMRKRAGQTSDKVGLAGATVGG